MSELGRNIIEIMDRTGDTKQMWDSRNPEEVSNARRTFNDFKEKRYIIYRVNKDGSTGELMTEFDPNAERMIIMPPAFGG